MRQVEEALVSHLREFSLLLGKQAALAVPEQLTEVRSGRDLALRRTTTSCRCPTRCCSTAWPRSAAPRRSGPS